MSASAWKQVPRADIPRFDTLMQYVQHYAERTPAAVAVTDYGGDSLTYADLPEAVRDIQGRLITAGVEPGDVVATLAPPSIDHWLTFLAAADLGAVWLGLNPRYRFDELRDIFTVARPKAMFAREVIGARDYSDDTLRLEQEFEVERLSSAPVSIPAEPVRPDDPAQPCVLVFTSGSTGKPKGVLLHQSGLVSCGRISAHHYGHRGAVALNPLPINHVGCIVDIGVTALVMGGTQVFLEEFVPSTYMDALVSMQATLLGGVPAMLLYLMTVPEFWNADLSKVQRIIWSGGAMPRTGADVLASLEKPMHNFYSLTETTGGFTFTAPDADVNQLVETVGFPDPEWVVRIADPVSAEERGTDEVGEIQVRGPGVLHSYLGDPKATADAFTSDGFFKTTDLGVRHADGTVSLAGRLKEMFKTGGYNVFPRQVEEAIETLPGVIMATVVAVPDDMLGEVGVAFVTAVPGSALDEEDLRRRLKERLASYKIPKRFISVDEPPLLPSGKVDRAALSALASATPA